MDVLRVLSLADLEVRKKTLTLVLDLITSKNIDEVHTHTHTIFSTMHSLSYSAAIYSPFHLNMSIYLTIHPFIQLFIHLSNCPSIYPMIILYRL